MAITNLLSYLLITSLSLTSLLVAAAATLDQPPNVPVRAKRASSHQATTLIPQFLSAHNKARAKHGIPPLKWSSKLANYAKSYANSRRRDCKLVHSNADFGENIFWGQGKRWKVGDAVAAWTVQENYYNYSSNTCMANRDCLHYTQVVWRSSKYVGCAKMKCNNGGTYVVCEYYPYGNIIGERPY